ncbi:unnamed protein product [Linum tenue]|uniref:SWI/SNF complex subunit SWI3A n=2 Tax=Linum tenue TaxID=586396 RepID=A0AAV0MLX2_9ROSI|nr:unnamed protein product [Linum tenue]CAI0446533.1 unnamed protein product [Linum tenue]
METTTRQDPKAESTRPDEPEFDLYTIPSYSSWFRWNDIHETERAAMREFFDGSSVTRSPKIYKEYRDFMINRYREDPSTRLTFTEVRKSLVGDVSLLNKVFQFLNQWGLINFGADSARIESENEYKDEVRVEDGPPNGIRVVADPNSSKPFPASHAGAPLGADVRRSKLSPLASYSDVFGELGKRKGILCGSCGGNCESGRYQHDKDSYVLCVKCFKDGKYGNKSVDDFKLHGSSVSDGKQRDAWTEAETLLLLESVSRHGDDWDIVAQTVKSKTKLECISKLIELPFGEFISSYNLGKDPASGLSGNGDGGKDVFPSLPEQQDMIKSENVMSQQANGNEQRGDDADKVPPLKKQCVSYSSGSGISIMRQIARISSMVGDDITATAAKAAFAALCDEASCPSDSFNNEEDFANELWPAMDQSVSERWLICAEYNYACLD